MPPATYINISDLQKCGSALTGPLVAEAGCDKPAGSCGSRAGAEDLSPEVWEKIKDHPCYSESAHHHYARMHIAVAPACNIQCNYCNRKYDCSNESRPGVVSQKLSPDQAVRKVLAVAARIPQMTVLGIAGPGDALANPEKTFSTFRKVREQAPEIKFCLSTNGLALPDQVDQICALGIDHVTITIKEPRGSGLAFDHFDDPHFFRVSSCTRDMGSTRFRRWPAGKRRMPRCEEHRKAVCVNSALRV